MNVNTKILSTTLIIAAIFSSNVYAMHSFAKKRVAVIKKVRTQQSKPRIAQRSTCFDVIDCYSCYKSALARKNPDDFRKNLLNNCCNPAYPIIQSILPTLVENGDAIRTKEALKFDLLQYPAIDKKEFLTRNINDLVEVAQGHLERIPCKGDCCSCNNEKARYQDIVTQLTDYKQRL
jgi:hypothetical protein